MDELGEKFELYKAKSYMIKVDADDSEALLQSIVENMDIETNLKSKITFSKRKNKAEIFDRKVVVGNQKTKITVIVQRIKNTKNTYKVSYDIELPNRPIFSIILILIFIIGTISTIVMGLIGCIVFYYMFRHSEAKKIQQAFPIKSILDDAISKLSTDGAEFTSKI